MTNGFSNNNNNDNATVVHGQGVSFISHQHNDYNKTSSHHNENINMSSINGNDHNSSVFKNGSFNTIMSINSNSNVDMANNNTPFQDDHQSIIYLTPIQTPFVSLMNSTNTSSLHSPQIHGLSQSHLASGFHLQPTSSSHQSQYPKTQLVVQQNLIHASELLGYCDVTNPKSLIPFGFGFLNGTGCPLPIDWTVNYKAYDPFELNSATNHNFKPSSLSSTTVSNSNHEHQDGSCICDKNQLENNLNKLTYQHEAHSPINFYRKEQDGNDTAIQESIILDNNLVNNTSTFNFPISRQPSFSQETHLNVTQNDNILNSNITKIPSRKQNVYQELEKKYWDFHSGSPQQSSAFNEYSKSLPNLTQDTPSILYHEVIQQYQQEKCEDMENAMTKDTEESVDIEKTPSALNFPCLLAPFHPASNLCDATCNSKEPEYDEKQYIPNEHRIGSEAYGKITSDVHSQNNQNHVIKYTNNTPLTTQKSNCFSLCTPPSSTSKPKDDNKKWICRIGHCDKRYKTSAGLRYHMKTVHCLVGKEVLPHYFSTISSSTSTQHNADRLFKTKQQKKNCNNNNLNDSNQMKSLLEPNTQVIVSDHSEFNMINQPNINKTKMIDDDDDNDDDNLSIFPYSITDFFTKPAPSFTSFDANNDVPGSLEEFYQMMPLYAIHNQIYCQQIPNASVAPQSVQGMAESINHPNFIHGSMNLRENGKQNDSYHDFNMLLHLSSTPNDSLLQTNDNMTDSYSQASSINERQVITSDLKEGGKDMTLLYGFDEEDKENQEPLSMMLMMKNSICSSSNGT